MFVVYQCLTHSHDYRLVLLAAAICLLSSITAVSVLPRIGISHGVRRHAWLAAASTVTGIGVWSTHFIAMLAFRPNLPTGYDTGLTVLSLAAAVALFYAAFATAFARKLPVAPAVGGAIAGMAISVMHFIGMAAFRTEGHILWNDTLVAWSIGLGMVFGAGALTLALRRSGMGWKVVAALVLTLAICSMHFTAMGAASILPDPTVTVIRGSLPNQWLAVGVAFSALSLLILSLGALLLERQQRLGEQRRLHELANAAVEGLVVCDNGVIVTANTSFERLVGAGQAQIVGRTLASFFSDKAVGEQLSSIEDIRLETQIETAEGDLAPVEVIARLMPYNGEMRQGVAVRDLRARQAAEARIRFLAHHDALTGLPNRASFNERLEREFQTHRRKGDTFAVLCFDLDRFKQVNDVFGHGAGDTVLRAVSERLSRVIDPSDVLARLGGDEFALIRLGPCRPADLAQLGEHILAAITPEIAFGEQTTIVGVSMGIAVYPGDGDTPDSLVRNADAALYQAKEDGRGAYRFFEAKLGAQMRDRQLLEFDLRHALARNELSIVYQPQTALNERQQVFGFEALLRWNNPRRGPVAPDVFVPIAEESGLILPIGEWVLRQACAEAASWANPLQIAVNLSGVQLHAPNLPALVHEILLQTGLPAQRLELEITETALIQDFAHALHTLRQIKALGVKIAMDDFGTGYSSLSNLRAFPFDKIKIDKSFVRNVHKNEQAAAIVRAILGLARGLNLTVLAEGVENPDELDFLNQELCGEAQGYLFGRPGDISQFSELTGDETTAVRAAAARA